MGFAEAGRGLVGAQNRDVLGICGRGGDRGRETGQRRVPWQLLPSTIVLYSSSEMANCGCCPGVNLADSKIKKNVIRIPLVK